MKTESNNSSKLLTKGERLNWGSLDNMQPVNFNEEVKSQKLTENDLASVRQQSKDKLLVP